MEQRDVAARAHEVDRGQQAKAIMENPLFLEAFTAVETELITQWKQNAKLGQEGRERCFLMVTLLGQLKAVLTQHMETGEMARLQLQQHRTLKDRMAGMRFGNS